ncbi:MAG: hypothetical protein HC881_09905 [Leptolyngbyaceae cyanobacterium SL_7_1]|nr:hypothetical protein [Leptolyngbyaceae cyanobacterium SL_7_1]
MSHVYSLHLLGSVATALPILLTIALPLTAAPSASPPTTEAPLTESSSIDRLSTMFSSDIQNTLYACFEHGRADLVLESPDGLLVCADGTHATVTHRAYINTVSDVFAASAMVGFQVAMQLYPQITPQMVTLFLENPETIGVMRQMIEATVIQNAFLPGEATQSTDILVDAVMNRIQTTLQDESYLLNLLGTPAQYEQVVASFCTAPGMSVEEATAIVPLDSIQLYAICIQESGLAGEMLQLMNEG